MRFALLCTCLLALGCSAVVNPDDSRLGDEPDGGGIVITDSGIRLMDAGNPLPDGSPPPEDGGPPPPEDGGPPMMCEGDPRCAGDVLVSCSEDGFVQRRDCAEEDAFCEGAECNPQNCEPGEARCNGSFSASFVCDDRGVGEVRMNCDRGCAFSTGRCRGDDPPPTTCEDIDSISVGGDDEVDLCDRANGTSYIGGEDCRGDSDADSGEQVYRLTLTEDTNVEIEVYDIDEGRAVDTVVYLRRSCENADSQIACADDVPCGESDFPGGPRCIGEGEGEEVRQSILRARLAEGEYFIVVDAHDYRSGATFYSCGEVRVEVREFEGG
ncbi:MAG: hypothetical protein AB8I08_13100 [Sandaracinaceae bacterium]